MQTDDPATDEQLLGEGLAWVEKMISDEAVDTDAAALREWHARGPRQARALRHAMRVLRTTEQFSRESSAAVSGASVVAIPRQAANDRWPVSRRALLGGAIAASVGGAMFIRPPIGLWPSFAELMADARTGAGERRSFVVAQNVVAELNTRTSISTHDGGDSLRVTLIAGEAVFENRHGRNVVIAAQGGTVLVPHGGRVAVRDDSSSVCVTCLAGSALAEQDGRQAKLAPHQQVVYSPGTITMPETVDLDLAMAWQRGFLIFRNTPLAAVVAELNRYRPGRIILASGELSQRLVYGTFRTDRTDAAIAQVERLTGARAVSLPGGIVLLG